MSKAPCVPVTADPNEEGYVSWALEPAAGEIFRIIEIQTNRGSLVIEIGTSKGANQFMASAMDVLSTLQQNKR